MTPRRNAAAGGIFLYVAPVLGLLYGLGRGDPIKWMLIGFALGVALALLTWIVDRRSR